MGKRCKCSHLSAWEALLAGMATFAPKDAARIIALSRKGFAAASLTGTMADAICAADHAPRISMMVTPGKHTTRLRCADWSIVLRYSPKTGVASLSYEDRELAPDPAGIRAWGAVVASLKGAK